MSERTRNAIVGAVAMLVIAALLYVLILDLSGTFKSGPKIEAEFARAGQLLRAGSDVKMRGVLVGEVTGIDVDRSGRARVTMRLHPDEMVPKNIDAAIRAKTLFGEKFIDLIPPKVEEGRIAEGDVIPESRTTPPIEVETILEKGVPILDAVDPEAFASGLHALAEGLVGNEESLRRANVQSAKLLTETERTLPSFQRNLVHLQHFADALDATDTDLIQALDGLEKVGRAISDHPQAFNDTVGGLNELAGNLGDVLSARTNDLGDIAGHGAAVLKVVRDRKDKLPNTVRVLDGFLSVWVADLSDGPYWRIAVTNPTQLLGTPYGAGQAPAPRSATAAAVLKAGPTPVKGLVQILTGAVTKPLAGTVQRLNPLLGGLRR